MPRGPRYVRASFLSDGRMGGFFLYCFTWDLRGLPDVRSAFCIAFYGVMWTCEYCFRTLMMAGFFLQECYVLCLVGISLHFFYMPLPLSIPPACETYLEKHCVSLKNLILLSREGFTNIHVSCTRSPRLWISIRLSQKHLSYVGIEPVTLRTTRWWEPLSYPCRHLHSNNSKKTSLKNSLTTLKKQHINNLSKSHNKILYPRLRGTSTINTLHHKQNTHKSPQICK